ncbi:hypothetical protein [Mycoplasma suis]|uniref:Uncharacterized protein n=1 Tax=Mycoplasma suis (strain Illinois) TaxID=768700 RepID=F0QR70_MYCSL|nr:hypothetical protein [Mycoplasma suis]ADX97990.1 hypothetical protein MSU_0454 [Mycoplasma suis str. Illinois]
MKLSISAIPSDLKWDGKECFPIYVTYEEGGIDSLADLKASWSPAAFPLPEKVRAFNIDEQRKYMDNILTLKKEIGYYCAARDMLSINRDLLYHYIMLGCEIQNALKRILVRLLPEMAEFKKITFNAMCSLESLELKKSSRIIEKNEEFLSAKLK